jgi:hypothetical protein
MTKLTTILMFVIISLYSSGQSYDLEVIRDNGKKYLKSYFVDTTILNYCYPFKDVLIGYKLGKSKDTLIERIENNNSFKGKFVFAKVCWSIRIPYPKCPTCDTLNGIVCITLDKSLTKISEPDLSFIPQSFYSNDSCNFISERQALEIAKGQNFKLGTDSLYTVIVFDKKRKIYTWDISQTVCKERDTLGRCWGEIEILKLSALTGEVLSHHLTSLGHP